MKWYFASRVRHQEKLKKIAEFLKSHNQDFLSEWVFAESLKPYHENISEVSKLANAVVSAISESDIFILISDQEGTDMFVELGIALASNARIYIVGEHGTRSLMQLHPRIIHTENLKKVFEQENIALDSMDGLSLEF